MPRSAFGPPVLARTLSWKIPSFLSLRHTDCGLISGAFQDKVTAKLCLLKCNAKNGSWQTKHPVGCVRAWQYLTKKHEDAFLGLGLAPLLEPSARHW